MKISETIPEVKASVKSQIKYLKSKIYQTFTVKSNQDFIQYVRKNFICNKKTNNMPKHKIKMSSKKIIDSNESSFFDLKKNDESQNQNSMIIDSKKNTNKDFSKSEKIINSNKNLRIYTPENENFGIENFVVAKIGNTLNFQIKLEESIIDKKEIVCKVGHLFLFKDYPGYKNELYSDLRVRKILDGDIPESQAEEKFKKGIIKMGLNKWLTTNKYEDQNKNKWLSMVESKENRWFTSLKMGILFGMTLGVFYMKSRSK